MQAPAPDPTQPRVPDRKPRPWIAKKLSRLLKRSARPALNRMLARFSRVGDPVVFDPLVFPWTKDLEAHVDEIRREALQLYSLRDVLPTFHEVSPYQKRISKGQQWKTAWLHGFGYDSELAQILCPETTRLLGRVPEMKTALFSMLAPGTHITAHRGVYKGLINYHLGLVVPRESHRCHMRVGPHDFHWEAGRSYVFDDTNTHEVWNETEDARIVLMIQFHRPFTRFGRALSELFLWGLRLTPYLRTPRRNVRESDERLRRAAEERGLLRSTPGGTP